MTSNHYPCSDDPEFISGVGHIKCPICGRLFSEHAHDELCNHWEEMFARVKVEHEIHVIFATDPAKPKP